MAIKDALQYVKNHPAGRVKIAFTDIDGILRGKYISTKKFLNIADGTTGFCDVIFGWDSADVTYDNTTYTGWHSGYPDTPARIDLSSFRKIPWEDEAPFFLGDVLNDKGDAAYVCPRHLLRTILTQADHDGYKAILSQEFEWFNFAETPKSLEQKRYTGLEPLTPGMFGYSILRASLKNKFTAALFDYLVKFGIPLESLHTETGPGVYEAAIDCTPGVEAGDRAALFKTAVKEIAYRHEIMATFMAKVDEHLPGCGGHVHQSLWDKAGKRNLFFDEDDSNKMSHLMKHYVAGQLHCLPAILPMYAPTVNSYKRLVQGAWAPTTQTWGMDNRTVALRVLTGGEKSARLETRVIGSDANPYLAMAAAVASGLYGIRKKLELKQQPTVGNGYTDTTHGTLPSTLHDATAKMKSSDLPTELFGSKFVEHFIQTREWEWRQHLKPVTDWERRRYFEII